jgi:hypothetical protein
MMVILNPKDRELFAAFMNETLSPEQSYNLARSTIDKEDFRKSKIATLGIEAESREWNEFSKSDTYRNVLRAEGLLSKDFSVSQDHISDVLSKGGMSKSEINNVFDNLKSHKDVEAWHNKFTGETTYRKKS